MRNSDKLNKDIARANHGETEHDPSASATPPLTRRKLLQGAAAVGTAALLPELAFGQSNGQPRPTSGSFASATCTVSATSIGSIPTFFNGLSWEKLYAGNGAFTGSNSALIALMNRLGPGVLRFGGYMVDKQVWDKTGPGGQANGGGTGTISEIDVENVNDVLNATGWQCIWGINFNGNTTTALATDEAAIVRDVLGSKLIGIEIGNEPESYGMTQAAFATKWKSFRDAIVARSPSMPLYAPVSAGVDWSNWFIQSSGYKSLIKGLDCHYYRASSGSYNPATVDNLVNPQPEPNLATVLTDLQQDVNGLGIPFRLAECNSISSGNQTTSSVSNMYASSLWGLEYLFQVALGKAAGVNFHSGDGRSPYTAFAMNYTGPVITVRPLYYGLYLFQQIGTGTLYQTSFSGNKWTRAYAVKGSTLKVVLVNTDSSTNLQMTINVYGTVKSATLIEMTQLSSGASGPSLTALDSVTIAGAEVNLDGSYSPQAPYTLTTSGSTISCYVPYLTACVVEVMM